MSTYPDPNKAQPQQQPYYGNPQQQYGGPSAPAPVYGYGPPPQPMMQSPGAPMQYGYGQPHQPSPNGQYGYPAQPTYMQPMQQPQPVVVQQEGRTNSNAEDCCLGCTGCLAACCAFSICLSIFN